MVGVAGGHATAHTSSHSTTHGSTVHTGIAPHEIALTATRGAHPVTGMTSPAPSEPVEPYPPWIVATWCVLMIAALVVLLGTVISEAGKPKEKA